MQEATTVLGIIRNRGERGLPLKNLYRQLYNPQFYFQAYVRLYPNDGAMTPDTTGETVDGMSKEIQEVVRQLLNAYFEPRFSGHSHGFRPGRGCRTALSEIVHGWKGVHWLIEDDISDCFGRLSHEVLLDILSEHIHDNRFLRLIRQMLQAGYLEEWRWHETLRGHTEIN